MKQYLFKKVRILIADNDTYIASVVKQNLRAFGFVHIHHVRNSTEAIDYIKQNPIDIIITEWVLTPHDGIDLVRYVRRSEDSPNRTIPIIMLTGKGEATDVMTARDTGITEFLVKPFTAQTLLQRLEYIVDHARLFVVSQDYVGPDRRRRALPEGQSERRQRKEKIVANASDALKGDLSNAAVILPKGELRQKMEIPLLFSSIITPAMLAVAQKAIDALHDESMLWIREDLARLEEGFTLVKKSALDKDNASLEQMKEAALLIKSRAGTFGHSLASEVSRILYLFLSSHYVSTDDLHNHIVDQCISATKVVFTQSSKKQEIVGKQLIRELEQLIHRVSPH